VPARGGASARDVSIGALKKLSFEELMAVEVTSVSRRGEKLSETASAIQVITGAEIARSGATVLPEALRLASNLNVAQQNPHDWNISARGFNTDLANKLLVLIDGRTVYTPLFSGVFWDQQDYLLEDIDRIEVISGPGGTLWGANAVNGVINVISKSARDTLGYFASAAAGDELRGLAAARYGATLAPGVYLRVYGKYLDYRPGVLATGATASNAWRMRRGGFRLDAENLPGHSFTLQGDIYGGDEGSTTGGTSRVGGGNLLGRWSRQFTATSDATLQVYFDRTHLALAKASNGFAPAGIFGDDLDTYDIDFQHRVAVGRRHRVVWGLGYRFMHDVVRNAPSLVLLPERLDRELFSGFAQDEIAVGDAVSLVLGTKVEHNDYTGVEIEPNVRVRVTFSPDQIAWAAVSRAVRTPSRLDRDSSQPTLLAPPLPASILDGGPDFRSETLLAGEVGYRAAIGQTGSVSLAAFYHEYDHVRSTQPGPAGPPSFGFPLVFHNDLEGETHGIELTCTWQPTPWWQLRGGYTLLREHLQVKPGRTDFSNALNETADPQQQVSLRSAVDVTDRATIDAAFRWIDTLHNNNGPTRGTVPSYAELDVRIAWRPTETLELSLVGQNLLHARHPEYGFPSATREEVERAIHGRITWRF
jgi:iron complex outermembrane receptor protein